VSIESTPSLPRTLLVGAPRPLLSRRAEEALGLRHRCVLDGLEGLLRSGELTGLTIGELASRLECSRRTLYELAPSKDHLILIVVDRLMHRIGHTALGAVDAAAPAAVQLRQYATASLGYVLESTATESMSELPGIRRVLESHQRFAATVIERIVARGIDAGEFRPVDAAVAAAVILSSAVHLSRPDVLDDLGVSLGDAVVQMLDLTMAGLVRRSPD
jgi:AcrR family transcriptional regulator